jgi:hypothetical protein
VTGDHYVGGIVGLGNSKSIVSGSYSNSTVTGTNTGSYHAFVGGVIGAITDSSEVINSYSSGSVSGNELVGGFIGYIIESTVDKCYSSSAVSGNFDVGGLIGGNESGVVSNSYWDKETSGLETSDGGTGKTTSEMKTMSTFANWDFDSTWGISTVENDGYPYLQGVGSAENPVLPYCEASTQYKDEYISNVQIGEIDNPSGWQEGMGNYQNLTTDLLTGTAVEIKVMINTFYVEDSVGVWIDWNQDEDFDDSNEFYKLSHSHNPNDPVPDDLLFSGLISVPDQALSGNTRMRVRLQYDSNLEPCEVSTYGEVEEYSVNVLENQNGWVELTAMYPDGRVKHGTATIPGTDKIVMFGGNTGSYNDETWIYDKSDAGWTKLEPTNSPASRYIHAMSYIGDDKVLLFGGIVSGGRNDETWVFDLSDEEWTQLNPASPPSPRYYSAMGYLGGDKIVLFGGDDGGRDGETWVFDLSDETWTQKTPGTAPGGREKHGMAYLGDDKAILYGGNDGGRDNETWIYDESDGTWTKTNPASKPSGRYIHTMSYIGDDKAILFGGFDGGRDSETWIYDYSEENWTQKSTADKPGGRYYSSVNYLGDGCAVLFGGDNGGYDDETWVFDLNNETWTQIQPTSKPSKRERHAMTQLGNDEILLFGGRDGSTYFNDSWFYNPTDNSWRQLNPADMPTNRDNHKLVNLNSEMVLLFGGYDSGYLDDTWLFDVLDSSWHELDITTKPTARDNYTMAFIDDGKALLFGGFDGDYSSETWLFDLADSSWTKLEPSNSPPARKDHSMTYIGGDKVMLFGGTSGSLKNDTWLFDLSDGDWTMLNPGTQPSARSGHMQVYLGGGRALLFGGDGGSVDDETWVFDLSTENWLMQSPAIKPSEREKSAIAQLGNGSVFLHGGNTDPDKMDDYWSYTMSLSPEKPVLISPVNGSNDLANSTELNWKKSALSGQYKVQVSRLQDFSVLDVDTVVTDTTLIFNITKYSTTFYWRVSGSFASVYSPWSDEWHFTTMERPVVDVPDSWDFIDRTGNNALVIVDSNSDIQLFDREIEINDAIGVFYINYDGEETCAGYGIWDGGNFAITVWGDNDITDEKDGFHENEDFIVKIWDGLEGREYLAEVSFDGPPYFTVDGTSLILWGNALQTVTQNINLLAGWNIVSRNVIPHYDHMQYIWSGIVDDLHVVKDSWGNVYLPSWGIDNIIFWDLGDGYQVYMLESSVLEITGLAVEPENHEVHVPSGWSIVPYLRNSPMDVETALANVLDDGSLGLVKNNAGKIFYPYFGINTIGNMVPGEGYKMYYFAPSYITYPANSMERSQGGEKHPDVKNLVPEHSRTGSDATLLVKVEAKDKSEVGVYNSNDVLIGSGVVVDGMAPVTVWGDNEKTRFTDGALDNEELEIRLYEGGALKTLQVSDISSMISESGQRGLSYQKDEVMMVEALRVETAEIILSVSPNPVTDEFRLNFTLENDGDVSIKIFSLSGELIKTITPQFYNSGTYSISENLEGIPIGEYNIVVEQDGHQAVEKIIKHK